MDYSPMIERRCGVEPPLLPGGAGLDRVASLYLVMASVANAIPSAGLKLSRGEMTAE
jgi:hypothetical protein